MNSLEEIHNKIKSFGLDEFGINVRVYDDGRFEDGIIIQLDNGVPKIALVDSMLIKAIENRESFIAFLNDHFEFDINEQPSMEVFLLPSVKPLKKGV